MDLDGWRPDPFGIHDERLFAHGEPTPLVRDDGVGCVDATFPARAGSSPAQSSVGNEPDQAQGAPVWITADRDAEPEADDRSPDGGSGRAPARPWFTAAALLIAAGVVVGLLGIAGVGRGGGAATTTTLNPLARILLNLPRSTTLKPAEHALRQPVTTTTESPIERALQALPKSTTPVPTTPATTAPPPTTAPSTTGPPVATHVTRPAPRPVTTAPAPIVAATALPLTTTTTSVGQADQAWYLAHGTVFNTLQTDIEKLDRTLASTSESSYATVIPYWKQLFDDAGQAETLPPIPDAATQSEWASSLGDLSEGATECIIGSAGTIGGTGIAVSIPPIYSQGAAFITTGTTQMDGAVQAVQSAVATTSASSRSGVSGWYKSHAAALTTLQADVSKADAALGSAGSAGYSAVAPDWQQLMSDAHSALALPSVPDPYIESLWTTALEDFTQGASDCLGSAEGLPPSPFDQGVALIESGNTYLSTTVTTVQRLVG